MDQVSLESHDDEMARRLSPAPIGISASPTTSGSSSAMTYTQVSRMLLFSTFHYSSTNLLVSRKIYIARLNVIENNCNDEK